jgi:hypothetical protein
LIGTCGSLNILRSIEKVVAQHDLVGGQPVRGDQGAAVEMLGGADVVEMLVAENHHVDGLGGQPT